MASNAKVATGSAAASTFNGRDVAAHFRQTWSAALADKPEMFRAPGGPGGAWGGAGSNAWSKPAGGAASHQSAMADGQQFLVGLSKAADQHYKSSSSIPKEQ